MRSFMETLSHDLRDEILSIGDTKTFEADEQIFREGYSVLFFFGYSIWPRKGRQVSKRWERNDSERF